MRKQVRDAVLEVAEHERFSKEIFSWVGFKTEWVCYENRERTHGSSKWSFHSLMDYAFNALTGPSSKIPGLPALLSALSFLVGAVMLVILIITGILTHGINGWAALLCAGFFFNAFQMAAILSVGQYAKKAYREAEKRPVYIEDKRKSVRPETDSIQRSRKDAHNNL